MKKARVLLSLALSMVMLLYSTLPVFADGEITGDAQIKVVDGVTFVYDNETGTFVPVEQTEFTGVLNPEEEVYEEVVDEWQPYDTCAALDLSAEEENSEFTVNGSVIADADVPATQTNEAVSVVVTDEKEASVTVTGDAVAEVQVDNSQQPKETSNATAVKVSSTAGGEAIVSIEGDAVANTEMSTELPYSVAYARAVDANAAGGSITVEVDNATATSTNTNNGFAGAWGVYAAGTDGGEVLVTVNGDISVKAVQENPDVDEPRPPLAYGIRADSSEGSVTVDVKGSVSADCPYNGQSVFPSAYAVNACSYFNGTTQVSVGGRSRRQCLYCYQFRRNSRGGY